MTHIPTPEEVDILVVFTRLHAERGASEDEFERDWVAPSSTGEFSGVLEDARGKCAYWVLSHDQKKGVMVVHGHKQLFGQQPGDFENTVIDQLNRSGLNNLPFNCASILVHGEIPEIQPPLTGSSAEKEHSGALKSRAKLEGRFRGGFALYDYSLRGKLPASLEVPARLKAIGVSESLRALIEDLFNIRPAVEMLVRSMQHILLEMRLWCDLHFSGKAHQNSAKEHLKECHARIAGDDCWKNVFVTTARKELCSVSTIYGYLKYPAQKLFRQTDAEPEETRDLYRKLFHLHAENDYLNCAQGAINALDSVLQKGELPSSGADANDTRKSLDSGLRVLSARLEALIPAARAIDDGRKKKSPREDAP